MLLARIVAGLSLSFVVRCPFCKTLCDATPRMATDGCAHIVGPCDSLTKAAVGEVASCPPCFCRPLAFWAAVKALSSEVSQQSPQGVRVRAQPHSRGCSRQCHRKGEEVGSGNRNAWGRQRPCQRSPRSIADCPEQERVAFSFGSGWSRASSSWNGPGRGCRELRTSSTRPPP